MAINLGDSALCLSLFKLQCLDNFQTLYAGLATLVAAIIGGVFVWIAARTPVRSQERRDRESAGQRRKYVLSILSADFRRLSARVRQAEGTIRAIISANKSVTDTVRGKTRLEMHAITQQWEFMSLLPSDIFDGVLLLQSKLNDHNFDMDRAGGAFGAENFRTSILNRTRSINGVVEHLRARVDAELEQRNRNSTPSS